MALLTRQKRWTVKPPIGAQINWGHPLANGLLSCFLFNEGGGLTVGDLANAGRSGAINNSSASTTWGACKNGVGLLKNGTSGAGYVTITPALPLQTVPFTCDALVYLTAVAGYQTITSNAAGNAGSAPDARYRAKSSSHGP